MSQRIMAARRVTVRPYFCFFVDSATGFWPRSGRCVAGRDYRITNQNQVVARIAAMRSTVRDVSNPDV